MCKKEAPLEGMSNRLMVGEFFVIDRCQVWKGFNKFSREHNLYRNSATRNAEAYGWFSIGRFIPTNEPVFL